MGKRIFAILAIVGIIASAPATAAEVKIGIINMQRALNDTDEGKIALEKLRGKLESENKLLKGKQEELKKIEDELNQQGYMLSEATRAEKQEKYKRATRDFEKYRDEKSKEFVGLQKEATEKILRKLADILKDYAKAEGYTVIFESSPQTQGMPGSVIWADGRMDITDKLIELYNKSAKAGGKN